MLTARFSIRKRTTYCRVSDGDRGTGWTPMPNRELISTDTGAGRSLRSPRNLFVGCKTASLISLQSICVLLFVAPRSTGLKRGQNIVQTQGLTFCTTDTRSLGQEKLYGLGKMDRFLAAGAKRNSATFVVRAISAGAG